MRDDFFSQTFCDDRPTLVVNVRHRAEAATVRTSISGDVDSLTADQLPEAVIGAVERYRPARLELDLGDVTFLDSAGIRALLQCHTAAQATGCRVVVLETPPIVYRVLEITGLVDHLGISKPA